MLDEKTSRGCNRGERMTKGQIKRKEMIRSTFIYNKVKTKK